MSSDELLSFITRLKADAQTMAKLEAGEEVDFVALAKDYGLSLSLEDLQSLQDEEMSAEELESVAGARPKIHSMNITKCCLSLIC